MPTVRLQTGGDGIEVIAGPGLTGPVADTDVDEADIPERVDIESFASVFPDYAQVFVAMQREEPVVAFPLNTPEGRLATFVYALKLRRDGREPEAQTVAERLGNQLAINSLLNQLRGLIHDG